MSNSEISQPCPENEEEAQENRRQALQGFLELCRARERRIDPNIDIPELIKEMYDIPEMTGRADDRED